MIELNEWLPGFAKLLPQMVSRGWTRTGGSRRANGRPTIAPYAPNSRPSGKLRPKT